MKRLCSRDIRLGLGLGLCRVKIMPCPTYSVSEMQVFAECDDGKTHTESAAG